MTLKPCPFCGAHHCVFWECADGESLAFCVGCGARSASKNSRESAETAWNRRVESPAPVVSIVSTEIVTTEFTPPAPVKMSRAKPATRKRHPDHSLARERRRARRKNTRP